MLANHYYLVEQYWGRELNYTRLTFSDGENLVRTRAQDVVNDDDFWQRLSSRDQKAVFYIFFDEQLKNQQQQMAALVSE